MTIFAYCRTGWAFGSGRYADVKSVVVGLGDRADAYALLVLE
ncbi:hypothetical protein [Nocardia rhamnosiphila]